MKAKLALSLIALVLLSVGPSAAWAQMAGHAMVTPNDLKCQGR